MMRPAAALLAAVLVLGELFPAARAHAQAAAPFPEVELPLRPRGSYRAAYACKLTGAALMGASFGFADRANRNYAAYESETDPERIGDLYDRTVTYDRLSTGSLLAGEALIAGGLYLRFLRRSPAAPLRLALGPRCCAVSVLF
jgi:hypothetical protein